MENAIKTTLLKQSNLFESLRFRYFGPVDGHDVHRLVKVMRDLRDIPGPKILHCLTVKGKGYELAEKGPDQVACTGSVRQDHRRDLQADER